MTYLQEIYISEYSDSVLKICRDCMCQILDGIIKNYITLYYVKYQMEILNFNNAIMKLRPE